MDLTTDQARPADQPAMGDAANADAQPAAEPGMTPSGEPLSMSSEIDRLGKRYQGWRMLLAAAEWLVEVLALAALLLLGWSARWRDAATAYADNPWLVVLLYLLPVGLLFVPISMGFSAVRVFVIDRRFGLSTESAGGWLADELKGLLVGGLLTVAAVEILYALLRHFPQSWWIWSGLVFSGLLIFITHLAPIVLFPLFFRFTRITDAEITERVERLAQQAGTRVADVYEADLSRKTRAANAALVGIGRTRRIVLADNLLDNFTLDEIEAILAHEFAHHTRHHLSAAIVLQTVTFFVLFYAIHKVLAVAGERWGLLGVGDVANLPLIVLTGTVLGLVLLPMVNSLLRSFERSADLYALQAASKPAAFCSALNRLAQMNLADRFPNPLIEWFFYGHPSIGKRVKWAEGVLGQRKPDAQESH